MDDTPDSRIFFLINRSRHVLLKWADAILAEKLSVTSAQLAALFLLEKEDGCLLKELSRGLGLNNSAITGLVARMEKAGLIEKRSCLADGRAFQVYITAKGSQTAADALPLVDRFNELAAEGFTKEEMETVCRFLGSVIQKISRADTPLP
ncbi:MarR family winged helix-turn-helix transcriptional regulator [Desulfoluna spongiiphila]|uniref:DNA-binding transcriptional regulator, MarR family n=1 Tax=Desulfoluna spongiiphila TaxID=419481 RepID=A0A1G5J5X5_9BACT|nr:MarR family winged helix-turn-helix transcriptional regulator [Desulfoluna spongiiphila]SCY83361.1 DNA-binding transcriptional regulator, MarR family [Desulfoluna spongiiphila]VVS93005.1 transcriptional regulator marr-type conserved site [Desulfoluna spongiiphila]